ncbi:hypothetical protein BH11PLA1_BH11PLA1_01770 [soil metagenome]
MDGGAGFISRHFVWLDSIDAMISSHVDLREARLDAPELRLFGSNGGGEAYGFDTRTTPWQVVMIPFVVMVWEDSIVLAHSFEGFLERAARNDDFFKPAQHSE